MTCTGTLDPWPVSVRAPGVDVVPGKEAGKLEISIPSDLAANRVWIRLYNAEGASAALPFLIGSLKEINDQEPNNSPRNAQAIAEPNVTINGILDGADVDGFAVSLMAGQTLVADVDGNNNLGSPMDAILQIALPDGTVVAENHDDVELDPRLAFTAETSGTYVARLFAFPSAPDTTIAFRGGANYIYRLTLTTGPFITHAVPMAASQAASGDVEVVGWNIPPNTRLPVVPLGGTRMVDSSEFETLADLRNTADARVGLAFAPNFAGAARIRLTPHAVVPVMAQSDATTPLVLTPPTAVTGRLRQALQQDKFRLPLKKGQQVVVSAETRSIESPLQPVLRLTDPAGTVAVNVDDPAPARAAILNYVAPNDGDYQLTVHDRFRQFGDRCFYRLTVRLEEPDFELSAAADAFVVGPDKPTELVVNVQRRAPPGVTIGPITIEAVELPPGVTAPAVVSEPTGDSAAKVTLTFSTTGPAYSGRIRIQGTAKQPQEITRLARTPPQFGACFDELWLTAIAKP
ncbi:MAG: PPC domain-containing protein [Planctomycetota bacterium]|nr:PPC domain-containing protein [Planctomycetota bacterium]